MSYRDSGTLTTDKRTVDETTSWDSTEDWEDNQESNNIVIENGVIKLDTSTKPDSGVSRWTFDDSDTDGNTAIDVWGDNDGDISGAETGVSGELDEAYDFDGDNDSVDVDSTTDFDLSEFSVSVWIENDSLDEAHRILCRNQLGENSDKSTFEVWMRDSDGIHFTVGSGDSKEEASSNDYSNGSWTHIVGTYDGSEMILYIDGDEKDSVSTSISPNDNGEGLLIGTGESDRYFPGKIDDPRIYDKGLSDTEVDNLYNTDSIDG